MLRYYVAIGSETVEGLSYDSDFGLKAISRSNFPALQRKVKSYEIDGVDGTQYETNGYQDRVFTVNYNFIDRNYINDSVRKIRKWLDNLVGKRLSLADDPEYFYFIKKVDYENIERIKKRKGKFSVTFTLAPFAYKFSNNQFIDVENGVSLYNDGDFESKPLIKVRGNGYVKMWINDFLIGFDVADEVLINSEKELCIESNINKNIKQGKYPLLKQEENIIRWEGNVVSVSINPNYIYY